MRKSVTFDNFLIFTETFHFNDFLRWKFVETFSSVRGGRSAPGPPTRRPYKPFAWTNSFSLTLHRLGQVRVSIFGSEPRMDREIFRVGGTLEDWRVPPLMSRSGKHGIGGHGRTPGRGWSVFEVRRGLRWCPKYVVLILLLFVFYNNFSPLTCFGSCLGGGRSSAAMGLRGWTQNPLCPK